MMDAAFGRPRSPRYSSKQSSPSADDGKPERVGGESPAPLHGILQVVRQQQGDARNHREGDEHVRVQERSFHLRPMLGWVPSSSKVIAVSRSMRLTERNNITATVTAMMRMTIVSGALNIPG